MNGCEIGRLGTRENPIQIDRGMALLPSPGGGGGGPVREVKERMISQVGGT